MGDGHQHDPLRGEELPHAGAGAVGAGGQLSRSQKTFQQP
eukprot:CAMPEP_0114110510 /NCGR_PEP_ID=MMETSP0043_2-20121206/1349_1 /TAXON_ID=464988 /ORGANISM="Hemiselmis andersenii, Strain CCMP644" /LENGTH=39 /DNA_ID= /DNA_START= /DNA_END= /DNA_ORIENTATION=